MEKAKILIIKHLGVVLVVGKKGKKIFEFHLG